MSNFEDSCINLMRHQAYERGVSAACHVKVGVKLAAMLAGKEGAPNQIRGGGPLVESALNELRQIHPEYFTSTVRKSAPASVKGLGNARARLEFANGDSSEIKL
jgi:hypothetical protein